MIGRLSLLTLAFLTACGSDSEGPAADEAASLPAASEPKPKAPTIKATPKAAAKVEDTAEAKRPTSLYVASDADLPKCEGAGEGALAYVAAKSEFVACLKGVWTAVEVKGKDGKDGQNGQDGQPATASEFNKISSTTSCSQTFSNRLFIHSVTRFASGDIHIGCEIYDNSRSYSGSGFAIRGTDEVAEEACIIGYDLDASSLGVFAFYKSGSSYDVLYVDGGSASDGLNYTFAANSCDTKTYP
jgi:hypothetical protein